MKSKHPMKFMQLIIALFLCISFNTDVVAQASEKIKMAELPSAAHHIIHGKYAKYNVNSMYRKQDEKDQLTFEVELQKKARVVTLKYDAEGNLLETRKTREIVFDGTDKPNKHLGGRGDSHAGHSH